MRILYKKLCMSTMIILSTLIAAHAQQTVTGVVTDVNGPIPGATVAVDGSTRGTQTDAEGRYSIQASQGETMVFSIIGYTRQTVTVGSSAMINITMVENASELGEVVVTALGIRRE